LFAVVAIVYNIHYSTLERPQTCGLHTLAARLQFSVGRLEFLEKATENLIDFTLFLTHIVLLVAAALECLPCGLCLCRCVLGSKQADAQLASAAVAAVLIAGTRSFG
jgi:hypothetical protein